MDLLPSRWANYMDTLADDENLIHRTLGTPDENVWPGISSYPDFKPTFPKWRRNLEKVCQSLDGEGLDLLELMLTYEPSSRISAKAACNHPYFDSYVEE